MTPTKRHDGRAPDELRPLTFRRRYTRQAPGSVLVRMGRTTVLCTCTIEPAVPPFLVGSGKGWLTAEYGMLPGSTNTRKARDRGLTPEESRATRKHLAWQRPLTDRPNYSHRRQKMASFGLVDEAKTS